MAPIVSRDEALGILTGAGVTVLGLWLWWSHDVLEALSLVLVGGFLCGALGADSGSDGIELAMGRILPVVLAVPVGWVFLELATTAGDTGAVVVAFVFLVSAIVTYVPLLFLPFALASALGGYASGTVGGSPDEDVAE